MALFRRQPTQAVPGKRARRRLLPWWLALAIVVVLHAVSAYALLDLHFNNAPEAYYPKDSPAVRLRDELRSHFPSDEVLTVAFTGSDLYSPDFLRRLDRAASELQRHPLVDRVLTVTTMERISGSADGFSVGKLVEVGNLNKLNGPALQKRVLADRFAPGALVSRDGTTMAMAVRPKALSESGQRLALSIAVAQAINTHGLRGHYAGEAGTVPLDVAQLTSIFSDSAVFVPATVGIGLALLWWVVGRFRPMVLGAVAMSTVVMPTIALIVTLGQPYTMATAILPSLLSAYTSATLLHLYAAIQKGHSLGLSRRSSVERALTDTFRPGVYNVLTTVAGIGSLVLVPIPPIQVFGLAGAFGTVMVFITVFVLLPPFLRHWDNRRWPVKSSGLGRFGRVAPKIAIFSLRHHKAVIIAAIGLTVACLPLVSRVSVESDILAFFSPSHPVNVHTRLVEDKLSGVTSLEVSIKADGQDSLQSIEALQHIKAFQAWLDQQPEVSRTVSFVDLVEEMNWAMNREKPAFRAIPRTDKLLRQYLLVYDGTDLYELVDRNFEHTRIVLSLNVHGTRAIAAAMTKIRDHLKSNPLPGLEVDIGGEARLFVDQSDLLIDGQLNSFAGAFGQIFLFMAILWRSVAAAGICMIPNLAPLYFVFVLMGTLGIHIDVATIMIAGVVLGITVDDTIHLYHGYKHRLASGMSPVHAIARSFESTGPAVMAISVLLISQFAMLACSSFIPTSNFGLMTAIGLFSGQAFELLLLPALLLLKDGGLRAARRRADSDLSGIPSTRL